ncbi:uroporphyrinogen-III synthase [Campylobacter sp. 19-13652]|uniref:uroporphyrinogen-III synthase n=1 Tax=Campylobacter sp. 19-13652 TaxID=2840180 RepID=UPI001C76131D|nr:uroporphyrinogen-III synthase [Campylobacter sp. 19-13652]BCX79129.1 hypothetical protein LBC_05910 [Campylobacter sp. 19-13652]
MIYLVSNTIFKDENIKQISLLEIKFFSFYVNLDAFEAIIISSKNSINALKFNAILPANVPVFAISKASAKAAFDFGFSEVYDFSASDAREFSQLLEPKIKQKRVLYLRGEDVAFNLALSLKNKGIEVSELICYKNEPVKSHILASPEPKSIIIFASALNFKAFFNKFGFSDDYVGIAIGKSTALAMSERGVSFQMPQNPSLKECVNLAKAIENKLASSKERLK